MVGGIIEGGLGLLIAIATAIFIFGQLKSNAERNAQDIDAIKDMIHTYQEDMKEILEKNVADMKELIDREKHSSRESLQNEIAHLRELVNINASETRADIQRLQAEQKESNNLKMKIAVLTSSVKALHHRLDIDPPVLLKDDDE